MVQPWLFQALIDRYVKKKHAKALAVASVACVAGLDAEPEEDSKELFEHMSEDDWTTVKHSMGIGNDFDTFQLLEDEPFDAEAESRPGNPKTGFFEIVPKEHWIPQHLGKANPMSMVLNG